MQKLAHGTQSASLVNKGDFCETPRSIEVGRGIARQNERISVSSDCPFEKVREPEDNEYADGKKVQDTHVHELSLDGDGGSFNLSALRDAGEDDSDCHDGLYGDLDAENATTPHRQSRVPSTRDKTAIIIEDDVEGDAILPTRFRADLRHIMDKLQAGQCLSDDTISSLLDLVPSPNFQVMSGALFGSDVLRSRLRVRDGISKIIAPVFLCLPIAHWGPGVFDLDQVSIELHNSVRTEEFSNAGKRQLLRIGDCLLQHNTDIKGPWTFREALDMPQQSNGWDCGIFVVVAAIHILLDLPLPHAIDGTLWRSLLRHLVQTSDTPEPETGDINATMVELDGVDKLSAEEFFAAEPRLATHIREALRHLQAMRIAMKATIGHITFQAHKTKERREGDEDVYALDEFAKSRVADLLARRCEGLSNKWRMAKEEALQKQKRLLRLHENYELLSRLWMRGIEFIEERKRSIDSSRKSLREISRQRWEQEEANPNRHPLRWRKARSAEKSSHV